MSEVLVNSDQTQKIFQTAMVEFKWVATVHQFITTFWVWEEAGVPGENMQTA